MSRSFHNDEFDSQLNEGIHTTVKDMPNTGVTGAAEDTDDHWKDIRVAQTAAQAAISEAVARHAEMEKHISLGEFQSIRRLSRGSKNSSIRATLEEKLSLSEQQNHRQKCEIIQLKRKQSELHSKCIHLEKEALKFREFNESIRSWTRQSLDLQVLLGKGDTPGNSKPFSDPPVGVGAHAVYSDDEDLQEDTPDFSEISFEGQDYLEDENNGDIYDCNHVIVGKWNTDCDDIIWSSEVAKVAHECNKD